MGDSQKSEPSTFLNNLKKYSLDFVLIAIILFCVGGILRPLIEGKEPNPDWNLVFLTSIYAIFTLWIASATYRSAQASERAVQVMEASLQEQRESRWAQFAASIAFPQGRIIYRSGDQTCQLFLSNLYSQPIEGLRVLVWFMEDGKGLDSKEVKYSSMMTSQPTDIHSDCKEFAIELQPAEEPESVAISLGSEALDRYKYVNGGKRPTSVLCAIVFGHRASSTPVILVYDLTIQESKFFSIVT